MITFTKTALFQSKVHVVDFHLKAVRDGSLFMGMTGSGNQKYPFHFFLTPMLKSCPDLAARLDSFQIFQNPFNLNSIKLDIKS